MPHETPVAEQSPPEDLAGQMELLENRLDRLEQEADQLAGTGQFPEWWTAEAAPSMPFIQRELKDPETPPHAISSYYQLSKRQGELRQKITGYDPGMDPLGMLVYAVGADVVTKGLRSETPDGPMHADLLMRLETAENNKHATIAPELDLVRAAYDVEKLSDLLNVRGDALADELRPRLRTGAVVRAMRYADREKVAIEDKWPEIQRKEHVWMAKTLASAAGISEEEAANYTFAASRRGEDKSVVEIMKRFDHFGVDRLRAISAFTGINAFETYSDTQLERMENLMLNPEKTAETLADHDVQVVMVNRFGDHNGVMNDASEVFESGDRTLFFEINSLADIYKHMLTLKKLGIGPSALVVAAHSAPGQFTVSDLRDPSLKRHDIATIASRKLVEFAAANNQFEPGERGNAMHGMKGMARIVDELMRPSRAIDDPEENRGKKQFVFQACDSGNEAESLDVDDQGVKHTRAVESVVSRLGQDLADSGIKSEVDIYGAPEGIQLHRSANGARYSGQPASFGEDRQPLHAVRVRVEKGKVTKQNVDEIPLRDVKRS
jgi:hypothetical protein